MTYATANRRPNAAALAGALGIPGGMAALLVVGLAVTVATKPKDNRLIGEVVTTPLPPPPPPTPDDQQAKTTTTTTTPTPDPRPADPSLAELPLGDPIPLPPGTGDSLGTGPIDLGIPDPAPTAELFEPVGARVRGNPGKWVTDADYRTRWIYEEMAGTARFTLSIDARGQVTGCTITKSTGHTPLDAATCDLVSKRARFDAARDNLGKPVAGSYKGVITWTIPK